jgi:putative membrane protein
MKKKFNFSTRLTATAFAAGALCLAIPAFAQEDQTEQSNTSQTEGATASPSSSASQSSSGDASTTGKSKAAGSKTATQTGKKNTGTASGPVTAALTKQDQQFMQTAAAANLEEIEMGKMAQEHGQSAEVKHLGMMMVTDHTQANTELGAVAQKHQVKLANQAPKSSLPSGSNFDQEWLKRMIPAHQRAISLFQTEIKQGSSSAVTGYANTTLPALQKHLRELQKAQGKVTS